ncbi:hypothetical protein PF005_g23163 [Phytophthora fragariae]|uniref:Uncharacterized protein n=2 Tax=Phytophthora TaxID=4783 RepID=A0A6A3X4Q4_9STRA|nr:hypothetical protein PF003_g38247 [Phytophthora fragariae]KAE9045148.1 hypothetical protein PR001_g5079 [Phytophthora rubi]KAE8943756.1 hypothetical protein PF009_g6529 [Phytophthora fragariae]KAE9007642.1 hypothetical protein PF011_g11041 [Phytophthora fragariae]KAE9045481.1 hypothetical protein PR002_g2210 [Phytophthora rubi]
MQPTTPTHLTTSCLDLFFMIRWVKASTCRLVSIRQSPTDKPSSSVHLSETYTQSQALCFHLCVVANYLGLPSRKRAKGNSSNCVSSLQRRVPHVRFLCCYYHWQRFYGALRTARGVPWR